MSKIISFDREAKEKLQVAKAKNITGGEDIVARPLFKKAYEYLPQFTPAILCNEKLELSRIDGGICRRIVICPFTNKFIIQEKDKDGNFIDLLPHQRIMDDKIKMLFLKDLAKYFRHIIMMIYGKVFFIMPILFASSLRSI
jgi:phage/plasmid-associated DNA primase